MKPHPINQSASASRVKSAAKRKNYEQMILENSGRPVNFHRKEVIFREGETVRGVYFVHTGQGKLIKKFGLKGFQIIRLAKPGDWLGLRDLQNLLHDHSAIALSELETFFVPKAELEGMMNENREIFYIYCATWAWSSTRWSTGFV